MLNNYSHNLSPIAVVGTSERPLKMCLLGRLHPMDIRIKEPEIRMQVSTDELLFKLPITPQVSIP